MKRFTLVFQDRELEKSFLQAFHDENARSARISAWVGSLGIAIFLGVDAFYQPSVDIRWRHFTAATAFATLAFASAQVARSRDPYRRLASLFVFPTCLSLTWLGLSVVRMALDNGTYVEVGLGSLNLMILGILVVLPVRFHISWILSGCCSALVAHGIIASQALSPRALYSFLTQLLVANLVGGAVAYIREKKNRRIFQLQTEMETEKQRSDNLIAAMLPGEVASKLKAGDVAFAETYPDVSVLFADLVGFSRVAHGLHPQDLVRLLNGLFKAFDQAVEAEGGEKIKTIGDAYMVAVGCPTKRADHANVAIMLAVAMRRAAQVYFAREKMDLDVRIGINSGMVVAGVLGEAKPTFDIWGDTVNIAARLENAAAPGAILVSESTWDMTRGMFSFGEKTVRELKGVGSVATYELRRAKQGKAAA